MLERISVKFCNGRFYQVVSVRRSPTPQSCCSDLLSFQPMTRMYPPKHVCTKNMFRTVTKNNSSHTFDIQHIVWPRLLFLSSFVFRNDWLKWLNAFELLRLYVWVDGLGVWHVRGTGMVHTEFLWGNLQERHPLEELGLEGDNIKMHYEEMWRGVRGLDLSGSGLGKLAGSGAHSNNISGSLKCGRFFYYLKNCSILKKDSAPWSRSVGRSVG